METEEHDSDWFGYECKSGQILFYYNKTTGEHRWPCGSDVSKLMYGFPMGYLPVKHSRT
jgi:hypothetical protein